jgi:hypothetical protein
MERKAIAARIGGETRIRRATVKGIITVKGWRPAAAGLIALLALSALLAGCGGAAFNNGSSNGNGNGDVADRGGPTGKAQALVFTTPT